MVVKDKYTESLSSLLSDGGSDEPSRFPPKRLTYERVDLNKTFSTLELINFTYPLQILSRGEKVQRIPYTLGIV